MISAARREFPFAFEPAYQRVGRLLGVTPRSCLVVVDGGSLAARFGPWRARTPLANVADVTITGPYGVLKTIGSAHLSLRDRGVTMATNRARGVCVTFHEPIRCLDPTGRLLRHPGLTVTVEDCEGLVAALERP